MRYYIGVDIGTSSTKLILIDHEGNIIAQGSRDYIIDQPNPGWKEINPEIWFEAVKQGLKEMLTSIDKTQIRGIGVTGQMHTIILMDDKGKPIRPAIMWNDNRTKEYIKDFKKEIEQHGDSPFIKKIISTGSPALNLYWMRVNEPENFEKLNKFLIGPDYIVYRFTGTADTDYCEASTSSLYDISNRKWSRTMGELIDLPGSVYPSIKGSAEIAGEILEEIADELGIPKDVKVITGTGDNPATAISTGCFTNPYPILSLGTSAVLMFTKKNLDINAKGKDILFSFDGESFYILTQGVVQSAGSSYSWLCKNILEFKEFGQEVNKIALDRLGENNLIFYPHLVGEKTIYSDPFIKGAFIGIGSDTTRADMVQAVMEGVCFGVKQLIEEMKLSHIDVLRVTGGGANSSVWMQIMADILNIKVETIFGNSGASQGIALLSAYSCGEFSSLNGMNKKIGKVLNTYHPRKYNASLYSNQYLRYKKVYNALKTIMQ
jgi:xylulokinase